MDDDTNDPRSEGLKTGKAVCDLYSLAALNTQDGVVPTDTTQGIGTAVRGYVMIRAAQLSREGWDGEAIGTWGTAFQEAFDAECDRWTARVQAADSLEELRAVLRSRS